ncbi:hypothetical protein N9F93_00475 [bacterium]|nr:hypothetical protein [bacterium]
MEPANFWYLVSVVLMLSASGWGSSGGRRAGLVAAVVTGYAVSYWAGGALLLEPFRFALEPNALDYTRSGFYLNAACISLFCIGALTARAILPALPIRELVRGRPSALPARVAVVALMLTVLSFLLAGILPSSVVTFLRKGLAIFAVAVMLSMDSVGSLGRLSHPVFKAIAFFVLYGVFTLSRGFVGFAVFLSLPLFTMAVLRTRRVRATLVVAPFLLFAALSFFVNYMGNRTDLREDLDDGRGAQVALVGNAKMDAGWFDPRSKSHLLAIDRRLNQNRLAGMARARIASGAIRHGGVAELWPALVFWVPRLVWPAKPMYGGSPEVVARATGLRFGENTSVGVGPPLELYLAIGFVGAAMVFLLLGVLVEYLDYAAALRLSRGDAWGFMRCALIGMPFCLSVDNLPTILGAAWLGVVLLWLVRHGMRLLIPGAEAV